MQACSVCHTLFWNCPSRVRHPLSVHTRPTQTSTSQTRGYDNLHHAAGLTSARSVSRSGHNPICPMHRCADSMYMYRDRHARAAHSHSVALPRAVGLGSWHTGPLPVCQMCECCAVLSRVHRKPYGYAWTRLGSTCSLGRRHVANADRLRTVRMGDSLWQKYVLPVLPWHAVQHSPGNTRYRSSPRLLRNVLSTSPDSISS